MASASFFHEKPSCAALFARRLFRVPSAISSERYFSRALFRPSAILAERYFFSAPAKRSMVVDEAYSPCCICEDECLDRSKCQCQQQTVAVSDSVSGAINPEAGYTFRSLPELLDTGIYECNSRCSCKTQCVNKVAQNGVQVRMQLFKTQKKGLGVRTVHDIPKGRFLCTYAGTLLTDREAESSGQDTYFAELDFIDVVCRSNLTKTACLHA